MNKNITINSLKRRIKMRRGEEKEEVVTIQGSCNQIRFTLLLGRGGCFREIIASRGRYRGKKRPKNEKEEGGVSK